MQDITMALVENQTTPSTAINSSQTSESPGVDAPQYHMVLLCIYSIVLLSGTVSLCLMVHIIRSSTASITSISILNLIFAHFLFLVTVPFRIYYYVTDNWGLSHGWCKVVSSMIHIHMYMSFIFYVIILVTRLMAFYNGAEHLASLRKIQALVVSAMVWIAVLVTVPIIIHFSYGKNDDYTTETQCFKFGKSIKAGAKVVNYIVSTLIIVVATVLTVLQANVLRVLYKKHSEGCSSQQEFGAQHKSMCFALIMVVCLIPYHLFRLCYLGDLSLEGANEVFLSLTTFNCLDMLTFLGRRNCFMCFGWAC
ncbi:putative G-protein coupled receptor 141 [Halichoeres trimaculatus]|uniref:putative G-protein coupled receptor 141 n=1 Tax=Halichoeres trimaculatus TaxID=147232 RepID=UPI003D9E9349